jgi:hypothetical protein
MNTKFKLKEVKAALRELERKGFVECCIIDGEVRWRLTDKDIGEEAIADICFA